MKTAMDRWPFGVRRDMLGLMLTIMGIMGLVLYILDVIG